MYIVHESSLYCLRYTCTILFFDSILYVVFLYFVLSWKKNVLGTETKFLHFEPCTKKLIAFPNNFSTLGIWFFKCFYKVWRYISVPCGYLQLKKILKNWTRYFIIFLFFLLNPWGVQVVWSNSLILCPGIFLHFSEGLDPSSFPP